MALINQATKEIQLKIVYYGPPQGGKTSNLEKVHAEVDAAPESKGKLTSLATNSDRTLFFDFLGASEAATSWPRGNCSPPSVKSPLTRSRPSRFTGRREPRRPACPFP